MKRWMIDCREATRLVLRAQDTPAPWTDRLRLRVHLAVCAACPRFVHQVKLMRTAMGGWRAYRDGDGDGDGESDDARVANPDDGRDGQDDAPPPR